MPKPLTDYLWIVDGHNLVLNVPELVRLYEHESKKAARDAAEERLAELAEGSKHPVHLVFDGQTFPGEQPPGGGGRGSVSVRFVDPPAEADDWIVTLARQEAGRGVSVAVATSDRGLLARLAGSPPIHRLGVEEFWRQSKRHIRQRTPRAPEKPQPEASTAEELHALEKAMSQPASPEPARPASDVEEWPVAPQPERAASREPPPAPPPRDWRKELAAKKERGLKRQKRRAARRKGR